MSKVIDSEGNIKVTGLGSVISQVITDGVTDKAPSENAVFDALALKANSADLATVATSGDYNDLSNLPTIPAAQVNSDWNATSGVAEILNKPTIPSVTGFVPYTGANADLDMGTHNVTADHISLNVSPSGAGFVVGSTQWNNTIGSSETLLKGGNVTLKNGVDLVARIVNKVTPNTTLTKANYQAVRVSGATGGRLSVELARADSDTNSADTIGLVCETIATNQEGFIITVGQLLDVNTTGSLQGETWVDGDVLYLSPTTAGRITKVKPTGAGHIVVIGYVEYAHANNGKIYVKIMNGWELDELHDVAITSVADNNLLQYDSATSLWKNESLSTAGIQPTLVSATNIKTVNGNSLLGSGDLVVGGGITVGTTAVTSGTVGRVFFQGTGNVVQQDSLFVFNPTTKAFGIGVSAPNGILNAVGGVSELRFSSGAGSSTPTLAVINTAAGGRAAALAAGTGGSVFAFDNGGFFAIVAESKASITSNSVGSGSIYFRVETNGNVGIGANAAAARLDVRAQGALSTDIAFRVRNSADNADLLNVAGNGAITGSRINLYTDFASQPRAELGASNVVSSYGISSILGNSNTINLQSGGQANVIGSSNTVAGGTLSVNIIGSGNSGAGSGLIMIGSNNSNHYEKENTVIIGSRIKMPSAGARPYQIKIGTGGNVSTSDIQGSFQLYLNNTDNSDLFLSNKTNLVLSNQTFIAGGTHFEVNATNTVTTHNGVAPTTNILNAFQLYSADITAGNAAPHFRTENGSIIKLYQQSSAGITTVGQLVTVLQNLGLLS